MPSPNWDGPRPLGPWAERRGQQRHVNSFPRPRSEISPHGGRHRTDREGATTALAVCPAPPPQRPSALHQPVQALDADLIGLGWCCRRYLVLALIRAPSHLLPDPVIDRPPPARPLPRRHCLDGKMANMFAHVGPLHRDQRRPRPGFLSGAVGVCHPCARWRSYLRVGGGICLGPGRDGCIVTGEYISDI